MWKKLKKLVLMAWLFVATDSVKVVKDQHVEKKEPMPNWYVWAMAEVGVCEEAGRAHSDRILFYHLHTDLKATTDETAWCSAFVNAGLYEAGIMGTRKANARSFLDWGIDTKKPKIGDIVILWRDKKTSWMGHVGFWAGEKNGFVQILGGNQGNKVSFQWYPKYQVLSYRRPVYKSEEA